MRAISKAIVLGFYGAQNVGDELLAASVDNWLTELGVEPVCITFDPSYSERIHKGRLAVSRYDLSSLARAMQDAQLFVLGGGGIFQEHNRLAVFDLYRFPGGSISEYAQICLMARQFGLPQVLLAQGVGPLHTEGGKQIVRDIFGHSDFVSVRDSGSADLLASIGVARKLVVAPDPIWAYQINGLAASVPASAPRPRQLAVVLRDWPFETTWFAKVKKALETVLAQGWGLRFVNYGGAADAILIDEMRASLAQNTSTVINAFESPLRVAEPFAGCGAVLSMRLHAMITALKCGVPVATLEYDPKVGAAAEDVGLSRLTRIPLEAQQNHYVAAIMALCGAEGDAQLLPNADTLMRLGSKAQAHRALLEEAVKTAARPIKERFWRAGDFDWVGTWAAQPAREQAKTALAAGSAEREQLVERLETASRERDEARSREHDARLALQDRDRQVADLQEQDKEREAEFATLAERLDSVVKHRNYFEFRMRALESSTSWRITAPLRRLKELTTVFPHVLPAMSQFLRAPRKFHKHATAAGIRKFFALTRTYGIATAANRALLGLQQPESSYLEHSRGQAHYIRAYVEQPIGSRQLRLSRFFRDVLGAKSVVLAPVAYDLQLSQRPDHLLEALTNAGYACIQLVMDSQPHFIRQRENGVYLTNMFEDAIAFFAKFDPILYLHYPRFRYFSETIPESVTIYDVLDDFSIFADAGPDMEADHIALLNSADVVLFSSSELLERNQDSCREALLIENGVWPSHFDTAKNEIADSSARSVPIRVGYHGAISELLDFDLLRRLAELPGVELVLVGPVASFAADRYPDLQRSFAELAARDNVVYKGKVSYQEISQYLGEIDVGIIPFIPGRATNAVSPLKLFEFIAAQKPVLATRTNTLAKFEGTIIVGEPDQLVDALRSGRWKRFDALKYTNVLQAHGWHSLAAPLVEFLQSRRPVDTVYPSPKRIERIDILNVSFFDWDGDKLFKGGAERYVTDLAQVCKKMGARVRLLQNANRPFERTFNGFPVIGVPSHVASWDFRVISKALSEHCGHADLVIASPLELAACVERERQPIVSINHGIHWDSVGNTHHEHGGQHRQLIVEALLRSAETVAVDTNFINWVRTIDWGLARSIRYIPNYVDLDAFKAVDKDFTGSLHILYPRRLYPARGLDLTIDSFESLLMRHSDIQLTFCGQANEEDSERVRRFVKRHQSCVRWVEREFDQMQSVYLESHIVLIPTLHSEGTSLSCIEAMATNNVVIATDIGGLPNLIIDRFNGLLIPPDSNELIRAVELLYEDRVLCSRLAANATSSSSAFAHAHWVEQWQYVIDSVSDYADLSRGRPLQPKCVTKSIRARCSASRHPELCST